MAEKSLLDTINDALDGETKPEVTPDPEETPEVTPDPAVESKDDEQVEEKDGDKPAEGEQTDEEKAAAEAETAKGQTPEQKAAAEAVAAEAAKTQTPEQKAEIAKAKAEAKAKEQTDKPEDAPIPRDLRPETQQRMRALVKTTKELRTQVEQATADRDELIGIVKDTGATPQQFGEMLSVVKQMNSSSPAEQEKALAYLLKTAEDLSRRVGKPMPGVNMLKDHADLMADVQSGAITRARAEEIAAAREARRAQDTRAQQDAEARSTTQARETGKAQLNALGNELAARDGLETYNAKAEVLITALKPVLAGTDPSNWGAVFRAAYEAVPKTGFIKASTAVAATGGAKPAVPANQPLRSRTPAGGQQKAPGSMLDAVNQALAGAA